MNRSRNWILAAALLTVVCTAPAVPTVAHAQAATANGVLEVGSRIPTSVIPSSSLDDLLTETAGRVRGEMVTKYGDFDSYWKTVRASREGKAFEAIVSDTVNHRNAATGVGRRLRTTASLGFPSDPCDLVELDKSGRVIRRIQAKLGYPGALDALSDVKYTGMDILVDQDTLDALKQKLVREQTRATLRGTQLPPKFRAVEEALGSGRLLNRLPCGAPLPTRSHISRTTERHARRLWNGAAKVLARVGQEVASRSPKSAARVAEKVAKTAKVAKVGLKVVPGAAIAYEAYVRGSEVQATEQRFARGEISQQEREVDHSRSAGKAVGGAFGAVVGAKAGAAAGAAIGSFAGPAGTAVGGVVGGLGGAVGGALGGEVVIGRATAAATRSIHSAGTTISSSGRRMGRAVSRRAQTAWRSFWSD